MLPNHPNVKQWKHIAGKLHISAYSYKGDMADTQRLFDGKSPREWLNGFNVRDDDVVLIIISFTLIT